MDADRRQVFAWSGLLDLRDGDASTWELIEHALSLSPRDRRVTYVPTAVGDGQPSIDRMVGAFTARRPDIDLTVLRLFPQPSVPDLRRHLLDQDVVLVEGGSVVNLMAVWQAHGLPAVLRECWEAGVVLTGTSAGSLCWHVGGPTDSFGDDLTPFTDGLGLLPYSNGVHDDLADQPRRQVLRDLVGSGALPRGYATEDGVGLHYRGTDLVEAVTIRPGARAWSVEATADGGVHSEPVVARRIGQPLPPRAAPPSVV
jgi:peptidase E